MITALISVLVITALVWFANHRLPFKVCPICAGVSLTWLGLTAGLLLGRLATPEYLIPIAMLMGATVVGIAYQGEKRFGWQGDTIWKWKVPVTVGGLAIAYWFFVSMSWVTLALEFVILLTLMFLFFVVPGRKDKVLGSKDADAERVKKLADDMESCC